jgi:Holliday junction resolvase RusA-like endonuclease
MSDLTQVSGVLRFTVYGKAVSQGSKRVIPVKTKDGGVRHCIIEQTDKALRLWRSDVVAAARAAYTGGVMLGAFRLALTFYRTRPQSHYGTGKHAGQLRDSAPRYPTTRHDTIKDARAIEDALTGVLWRDDSQICEHLIRKIFGECLRVDVEVQVLDS